MIDPVSLFSLIGLCGTISCRIAHIITNLDALRERYKNMWIAMESLDAQVTAIQAATAKLAFWLKDGSAAICEEECAGLMKSLMACERLMDTLQEHINGVKQGPGRFSLRGKSRYMWNEGSIREFRGLLQCQVQALSFHLQVLNLPSQADRNARLESNEGQQILKVAYDGTPSLFAFKDSDSVYSAQSDYSLRSCASKLSAVFSFDWEVIRSKVYRTALSSLMRNDPTLKCKGNYIPHSEGFPSEPTKLLRTSQIQSDKLERNPPDPSIDQLNEAEVAVQHRKSWKAGEDDHDTICTPIQRIKLRNTINDSEKLSEATQMQLALLDRGVMESIKSGDLQRAKLLISNPSNPSFPPRWFPWSLRRALDEEATDSLRYMFTHGFDLEAVDGSMRTPLYYACSQGLVTAVDVLLDQGASIESANFIGERPLHAACLFGHSVIVQCLLNRGASADSVNMKGETPLHYACLWGDSAITLALTERGADIWAKSAEGDTPLHYAISNAHPSIVSLLISTGPRPPMTDDPSKGYFDFLIQKLSNEERRIQSLNLEDYRSAHILKAASERLRKLVRCVELLVELQFEGHTYAKSQFRHSILFSLSLPQDSLLFDEGVLSTKSPCSTEGITWRIPHHELEDCEGPKRLPKSITWRIPPRQLTDWVERITDEDLYKCISRFKHGHIREGGIIKNATFATSSRVTRVPMSSPIVSDGIKVEMSINISIDILPSAESTDLHDSNIESFLTDGYVRYPSSMMITNSIRSHEKLSTMQQNILNGRLCSAVVLNQASTVENLLLCGADPYIIFESPPFFDYVQTQDRDEISTILRKY